MLVKVPEKFLIKNVILSTSDDDLYKHGELELDDCIADEIIDLWSRGIHTRGCCCGHKKFEGYIEVERTDIPKMLELNYDTFGMAVEAFTPKSTCHCGGGVNGGKET